jgi:hypothetical protein
MGESKVTRAPSNDLTIQQLDASLCPSCEIVIMGDQHNRLAAVVQVTQDVKDHISGLRIQIAGWLIRKKDVRVVYKRSCYRNPLLLTARELTRVIIEPVTKFQ